MKNLKRILGIIIIVLLFVSLNACSGKADEDGASGGKRDPISVEKIEWKKLLNDDNLYGIDHMKINIDGQEYILSDSMSFDKFSPLVEFFRQNSEKLYSSKNDGQAKVYIRFYHKSFTDISRSKYIYDNKQCTFYVDNSLKQSLVELCK